MRVFRIAGVILLAAAGLLQSAGLCWPVEKGLKELLAHVAGRFLPERPATVLLTLEPGDQGLRPLEVAMALRGLSRFHPARVVVNGPVEAETTEVPLLAGLLAKLRDSEFPVIVPVVPTPTSHIASVPLDRLDPLGAWVPRMAWPMFDGFSSEESSASPYQPAPGNNDGYLPLLGLTAKGEPIASPWWRLLNREGSSPSLLVLGRMLILPDRHPLWITEGAVLRPQVPGAVRTVALDDFLLRIEQLERGTINPGFDALWNHATVIIGTQRDLPKAASVSSLLERFSLRVQSFPLQALSLLVWIAAFLLITQLPSRTRNAAAGILLIVVLGSTLFCLHAGWSFPFLPGILAALMLPLSSLRPLDKR